MSKDDPYISRVEHRSGNSGFYWVRFAKGSSLDGSYRHEAQMTFTDLEFGGKKKALAAARKWRDKTAKKLNRNAGNQYQHSREKRKLKARSNTGVVGVSNVAYTKYDRGRSYWIEYYSAIYCVTDNSGKRRMKTKSFYYGERSRFTKREAFREAVKFRKEMEKLHYIN